MSFRTFAYNLIPRSAKDPIKKHLAITSVPWYRKIIEDLVFIFQCNLFIEHNLRQNGN